MCADSLDKSLFVASSRQCFQLTLIGHSLATDGSGRRFGFARTHSPGLPDSILSFRPSGRERPRAIQ